MSAAISPIAFKGFMLGYLHKQAVESTMPRKDDYPDSPANDPRWGTPIPDYHAEKGTAKGAYGQLGEALKGLAPGAAIGAAGVGGASLGVDALRGKPMNVKRAIILSMLLGIPLGAAGQVGVMGGIEGYKKFGGKAEGAGKQALSDILKGYGTAKTWTGQQVDKGKQLAQTGVNKGKKLVQTGVDKGKQLIQTGINGQ